MRPLSTLPMLALAAATLLPAAARAGGTLGPALDGSGSLRLDGGSPVPDGGAVVTAYGGLGPRPLAQARYDQIAGIGTLTRPVPAVELGIAFPTIRRRSDLLEGPILDPGSVMFVARTAVIPELTGVAVSVTGAVPLNRIEGLSDAPAVEPRLAVGRDLGPFRPILNAGVAFWADGDRLTWGGLGLRTTLPLGAHARFDVQVPIEARWRAGAGLAIPLGPGTVFVADGWRTTGDDGLADYEVLAAVVLRTSARGPGAPFRFDRDNDGVLNAEDECPRTCGDGRDGCPAPPVGIEGCECPLLEFSLLEVERLVVSLSAVPEGHINAVEVRVAASGDPYQDFEDTQFAVEGTRGALLDLGVPAGNFTVIGRAPAEDLGVPLLTVRQMPIWKAPGYIEATEMRTPAAPSM